VLPGLYPPLKEDPLLGGEVGGAVTGAMLAVENEGADAAGSANPVCGGCVAVGGVSDADGVAIAASEGGSVGKSNPPELSEGGGVV